MDIAFCPLIIGAKDSEALQSSGDNGKASTSYSGASELEKFHVNDVGVAAISPSLNMEIFHLIKCRNKNFKVLVGNKLIGIHWTTKHAMTRIL
ncbi:unnamed protein product [Prunus armeniaca]|uniref:Uncharacterized protein n=1 Tax=Prunus armeniaca TaxID=36596 RepID=A0A6J5UC35_PRUAR|nr:unnamed protein product [Prunus armeniaca]